MIKILLIDDDAAIFDVLSAALDPNEFEINPANTGFRGLDLAKTIKPDIIILDQILPDILGNEVLKTLKTDPDTKQIPVVVYTAYPTIETREGAFQYKKTHCLAKSDMDPSLLGVKIKEFLETSPSGK